MLNSAYIKGAGYSGSDLAVTKHDVRPPFIAPPPGLRFATPRSLSTPIQADYSHFKSLESKLLGVVAPPGTVFVEIEIVTSRSAICRFFAIELEGVDIDLGLGAIEWRSREFIWSHPMVLVMATTCSTPFQVL